MEGNSDILLIMKLIEQNYEYQNIEKVRYNNITNYFNLILILI